MEKNRDKKLAMVRAVSEVLKLKRGRKDVSHEQMMKEMEGFIHKTKDKGSRLMMVVAVSKTLDIIERNPKMSEKDVIKKMVSEFSSFIETAESED
ncbi:MAG: hypothetical protein ABIG37_00310 [Nanoarchaeota archaeon]